MCSLWHAPLSVLSIPKPKWWHPLSRLSRQERPGGAALACAWAAWAWLCAAEGGRVPFRRVTASTLHPEPRCEPPRVDGCHSGKTRGSSKDLPSTRGWQLSSWREAKGSPGRGGGGPRSSWRGSWAADG